MLDDFKQYKKTLKNIDFSVKYHITDGMGYDKQTKEDLCIGDGRYCQPSYEFYDGKRHQNNDRLST